MKKSIFFICPQMRRRRKNKICDTLLLSQSLNEKVQRDRETDRKIETAREEKRREREK